MKSSKQVVLNIPFGQSLWTHIRRRSTFRDDLSLHVEITEHWGKRDTCRKCHKDGTRGEFLNSLSGRGAALVCGVVVSCVVGLRLLVG